MRRLLACAAASLLMSGCDLVVDPFAGSNVTGMVAEALGRRWFSVDLDRDYVIGSESRFDNLQPELLPAES
jgi:site-specific DNA-methyltransferase (cytosine-N4-specific)